VAEEGEILIRMLQQAPPDEVTDVAAPTGQTEGLPPVDQVDPNAVPKVEGEQAPGMQQDEQSRSMRDRIPGADSVASKRKASDDFEVGDPVVHIDGSVSGVVVAVGPDSIQVKYSENGFSYSQTSSKSSWRKSASKRRASFSAGDRVVDLLTDPGTHVEGRVVGQSGKRGYVNVLWDPIPGTDEPMEEEVEERSIQKVASKRKASFQPGDKVVDKRFAGPDAPVETMSGVVREIRDTPNVNGGTVVVEWTSGQATVAREDNLEKVASIRRTAEIRFKTRVINIAPDGTEDDKWGEDKVFSTPEEAAQFLTSQGVGPGNSAVKIEPGGFFLASPEDIGGGASVSKAYYIDSSMNYEDMKKVFELVTGQEAPKRYASDPRVQGTQDYQNAMDFIKAHPEMVDGKQPQEAFNSIMDAMMSAGPGAPEFMDVSLVNALGDYLGMDLMGKLQAYQSKSASKRKADSYRITNQDSPYYGLFSNEPQEKERPLRHIDFNVGDRVVPVDSETASSLGIPDGTPGTVEYTGGDSVGVIWDGFPDTQPSVWSTQIRKTASKRVAEEDFYADKPKLGDRVRVLDYEHAGKEGEMGSSNDFTNKVLVVLDDGTRVRLWPGSIEKVASRRTAGEGNEAEAMQEFREREKQGREELSGRNADSSDFENLQDELIRDIDSKYGVNLEQLLRNQWVTNTASKRKADEFQMAAFPTYQNGEEVMIGDRVVEIGRPDHTGTIINTEANGITVDWNAGGGAWISSDRVKERLTKSASNSKIAMSEGDRVTHPQYGPGKIHHIDPTGGIGEPVADVLWDSGDRRNATVSDLSPEVSTKASRRSAASANYLKTFFEEKNLPYQSWSIESNDGTTHIIDNEVVIETILNVSSPQEQDKIADVIRRIDFASGDVNDFLKHLATGLVNSQLIASRKTAGVIGQVGEDLYVQGFEDGEGYFYTKDINQAKELDPKEQEEFKLWHDIDGKLVKRASSRFADRSSESFDDGDLVKVISFSRQDGGDFSSIEMNNLGTIGQVVGVADGIVDVKLPDGSIFPFQAGQLENLTSTTDNRADFTNRMINTSMRRLAGVYELYSVSGIEPEEEGGAWDVIPGDEGWQKISEPSVELTSDDPEGILQELISSHNLRSGMGRTLSIQEQEPGIFVIFEGDEPVWGAKKVASLKRKAMYVLDKNGRVLQVGDKINWGADIVVKITQIMPDGWLKTDRPDAESELVNRSMVGKVVENEPRGWDSYLTPVPSMASVKKVAIQVGTPVRVLPGAPGVLEGSEGKVSEVNEQGVEIEIEDPNDSLGMPEVFVVPAEFLEEIV